MQAIGEGGLSRDQEMMGGLGGDIGARDPTAGRNWLELWHEHVRSRGYGPHRQSDWERGEEVAGYGAVEKPVDSTVTSGCHGVHVIGRGDL